MDTATHTSRAATGAAPRHSPGAGCTRPTNGNAILDRRSSCASPSAASVQSEGFVSGQRTLTTLSTTREIGQDSATGAIWRACATAATAGRRRGNCTKIAGVLRSNLRSKGGRLGRSGAPHSRRAGISSGIPPRPKKFETAPWKPRALPQRRNFPHGGIADAAGGKHG